MSQPASFRQRLAANTAASMATNVWTIVLTIVSLPVVLHGLGAEQFGVWVFLQTFSATNGWLSVPAIGLSTASTRHVASSCSEGDEGGDRRAAGTTFVVFVASGVLFALAITSTVPTILTRALDLQGMELPSLRLLGSLVGLQVLAEHVCAATTSVLEGKQRVALARMIDALRRTASTVGIAATATTGGSLLAVAVASASSTAAVTTVAVLVLLRTDHLAIGRPVRADARSVVRYAGTVSALTGTGVLHRTMDRTIAGVAFGPSAVALVEIANQVQVGTTALLSASTYPVLSSAPWLDSRDDERGLRELFHRTTRYSVLLTFPLCALTITLAGPFVRIWVGGDFSEAIGLVQIAVAYVVFAAPLQAGSNLLQGVGDAGKVLRASFISVIVNLAASLLFTHLLGLMGVFVGTIAGALVLVPLLVAPISERVGHDSVRSIRSAITTATVPSVLGAAVAGAITLMDWPDPGALLLGGSLGLAVTAFASLSWSMSDAERRELVSALRRRPA